MVVVNGQAGKAPIKIDAAVGAALTLDAGGSRDPDGHALTYTWFFYPEAGTGIPGQPVFAGGLVADRRRRDAGRGRHPVRARRRPARAARRA